MGIMSLSEIMDASVEILKKHIKTIVTFNLAYGALCFMGIIAFIIVGAILTTLALISSSNGVVVGILLFILGIMIFTFIMCFKIGLIKISSQDVIQEKILASQAIGASFKKIFIVLGVIVMEIILYLPVAGVFAGIGYLFYNQFQTELLFSGIYDKNEIGSIIIIFVGILLIILSYLAYVTIFSFSFHAVAIENKGVFAALKRSYNLVRGDFFKILGCTILFTLTISTILYSLQSFLGIVMGIIYALLKLLNIEKDLLEFATIMYNYSSWPISALSFLVITPIGTIMTTYLYYNQRFKKEGYDIALKLNKLQKDEEKRQLCEVTKYNDSI